MPKGQLQKLAGRRRRLRRNQGSNADLFFRYRQRSREYGTGLLTEKSRRYWNTYNLGEH